MKVTRPPAADPRFISPARADGAQRQAPSDRVSFDASRSVAVGEAKARDTEQHAERLRRLEAAVREGTYRPDPALIADRLIDSSAWLRELDDELAQLQHGHAAGTEAPDAAADR